MVMNAGVGYRVSDTTESMVSIKRTSTIKWMELHTIVSRPDQSNQGIQTRKENFILYPSFATQRKISRKIHNFFPLKEIKKKTLISNPSLT